MAGKRLWIGQTNLWSNWVFEWVSASTFSMQRKFITLQTHRRKHGAALCLKLLSTRANSEHVYWPFTLILSALWRRLSSRRPTICSATELSWVTKQSSSPKRKSNESAEQERRDCRHGLGGRDEVRWGKGGSRSRRTRHEIRRTIASRYIHW